jgi:hypothetical protein
VTKSSVSLRERGRGRRLGREARARTAHEADLEAGALDEARGERVEAAGRLVRAGLGEDPAERRGRRLPRADDAGGLLGGEVRAARGHPGAVAGRSRRRLETIEKGWGGRRGVRACGVVTDLHYRHGLNRPTPTNRTAD